MARIAGNVESEKYIPRAVLGLVLESFGIDNEQRDWWERSGLRNVRCPRLCSKVVITSAYPPTETRLRILRPVNER